MKIVKRDAERKYIEDNFDIADPYDEPPNGSVLMVNGLSGLAYQRLSDGLYHPATGRDPLAYRELFDLRKRDDDWPVLLIHRAPERVKGGHRV